MSKMFYSKLAITNIKSNSRTYVPFLLTCVCTIAMFYSMCFIIYSSIFAKRPSVMSMLNLGVWIVGIFAVIFLFYTNSFLIKRRKKEFGLFNILGMEKKHIARIMTLETVFVGLLSIIFGLGVGVIFSKLMSLLLSKIIVLPIPFGFNISGRAIIISCILFAIIFAINLIYNLCQVHSSKPIELLRGGNVGEKEPKTKMITAIIGALFLGAGYYIAVTSENMIASIAFFFLAVIAVIIGTYCLFTAGSIVLLKLLRKNKKYYYQSKHFTSVSGMMYRMKQNAAGLASICILSTAVIIVISTTLSLYLGINDTIKTESPENITIKNYGANNKLDLDYAKEIDKIVEKEINESGYAIKEQNNYSYINAPVTLNGSDIISLKKDDEVINDAGFIKENVAVLSVFKLDDYNKVHGKNETLNQNEVLLYSRKNKSKLKEMNFNDSKFIVKDRIDKLKFPSSSLSEMIPEINIIVKDDVTFNEVLSIINKGAGASEQAQIMASYYYGFTPECTASQEVALKEKISEKLTALRESTQIVAFAESVADYKPVLLEQNGCFLFLGLFLGTLFIMATILIIYYKQVAEGYDDKKRFEIMQKVGMSHSEVKKAIHSQVLTVFFLPLVTAVIHIFFAFGIITQMLKLLHLTNIGLFTVCTIATILIFAIFYLITYMLTARTYYKVVSK